MYEYKSTVSKVVDGDTVDLVVDLGFRVYTKIRVRLARVDTAEMNTDEGKEVKALVQQKLPVGSEVMLTSSKGDRYGRWIGELVTGAGQNISDWLLEEGLAEEYR